MSTEDLCRIGPRPPGRRLVAAAMVRITEPAQRSGLLNMVVAQAVQHQGPPVGLDGPVVLRELVVDEAEAVLRRRLAGQVLRQFEE
jgi:hypothetical protein